MAKQALLLDSWKRCMLRKAQLSLAGSGLTGAVSDEENLHRIQLFLALLKAGVPLAKVDCLRPIQKTATSALIDISHLWLVIPFVLDEEKRQILLDLQPS